MWEEYLATILGNYFIHPNNNKKTHTNYYFMDESDGKFYGEIYPNFISKNMDETFSTWHRENEDRQQTFLQMDLEVGTKTNLKGGSARETESGDQAFASAQGTSRKSDQKDYSKLETLKQQVDKKAGNQSHTPYGEENIDSVAMIKEAKTPTEKIYNIRNVRN